MSHFGFEFGMFFGKEFLMTVVKSVDIPPTCGILWLKAIFSCSLSLNKFSVHFEMVKRRLIGRQLREKAFEWLPDEINYGVFPVAWNFLSAKTVSVKRFE